LSAEYHHDVFEQSDEAGLEFHGLMFVESLRRQLNGSAVVQERVSRPRSVRVADSVVLLPRNSTFAISKNECRSASWTADFSVESTAVKMLNPLIRGLVLRPLHWIVC